MLKEQQRTSCPLFGLDESLPVIIEEPAIEELIDVQPIVEEPESTVASEHSRQPSADLNYQEVTSDLDVPAQRGVVFEAPSPAVSPKLEGQIQEEMDDEDAEQALGHEVEDAIFAAENETPEEVHGLAQSASLGDERDIRRVMQEEMAKLDERLMRKVTSVLRAETEKNAMQLQQERLRHQAEETERQQKLLNIVSQTLSSNVARQLDTVVASQFQLKALPVIESSVKSAVQGLKHGLKDGPRATDPAVLEKIARSVEAMIRPTIKESVKEMFAQDIVPAMTRAVNVMMSQVSEALARKIDDCTSC